MASSKRQGRGRAGMLFLKAPVSGSKVSAQQGQVNLLIAGLAGMLAWSQRWLQFCHARGNMQANTLCARLIVLFSCFCPPGDAAFFKAAYGPLDFVGKAKFFLGREGQATTLEHHLRTALQHYVLCCCGCLQAMKRCSKLLQAPLMLWARQSSFWGRKAREQT